MNTPRSAFTLFRLLDRRVEDRHLRRARRCDTAGSRSPLMSSRMSCCQPKRCWMPTLSACAPDTYDSDAACTCDIAGMLLRPGLDAGAGHRRDRVGAERQVLVRNAAVSRARRAEVERRVAGADDDLGLNAYSGVVEGLVVAGLEQQVIGQRRRPLRLRDVLRPAGPAAGSLPASIVAGQVARGRGPCSPSRTSPSRCSSASACAGQPRRETP